MRNRNRPIVVVVLAAALVAAGLLPLVGWLGMIGGAPPASLLVVTGIMCAAASLLFFRPTRGVLITYLVLASISVLVEGANLYSTYEHRGFVADMARERSAYAGKWVDPDPETNHLVKKMDAIQDLQDLMHVALFLAACMVVGGMLVSRRTRQTLTGRAQ